MPSGVRYSSYEAAKKYADTFDDATGPTAVTLEMSDPDTGESYWVVVNKNPPAAVTEWETEGAGEGRNMGGVVDELGYRQGGINFTNRGPVKYAKGGAVRGKRFSGSY